MPELYKVIGYNVYFWSNENGEPFHVHFSKGKPAPNATKFWVLSDGTLKMANNNGRIPDKDLRRLVSYVENDTEYVIAEWERHFKERARFIDSSLGNDHVIK